MSMIPAPFRQSTEQAEAVRIAAEITGLSKAETMRKAIDFGLPILVEKLPKRAEIKV